MTINVFSLIMAIAFFRLSVSFAPSLPYVPKAILPGLWHSSLA